MMPHGLCAGRRPTAPAAFTLVEAVVAMAILAIAGSALLLGIDSSLQTSTESLEQTMANGLARQLLDEAAGSRYSTYLESSGALVDTAHYPALKPSASKASTGTRELFTDSDDYNGFRRQPPVDRWGIPLGQEDVDKRRRHASFYASTGLLDRWRQEIDVYYVSESDLATRLPAGQVSDYRAIEVRMVRVDAERGDRVLATVRQVIAYVPPLP